MNILTERFRLRAIESKDLSLLQEMMNDSSIEQNVGGWSWPISNKDQVDWYTSYKNSSTEVRLIIANIHDDTAVGLVALTEIDWKNRKAEIHIKIASKHRKKHIAYEALNGILQYVFDELGLNLIYAEIIEYNLASAKLFEKLGFEFESKLRQRIYKKGEYHGVLVYSLINQRGCHGDR